MPRHLSDPELRVPPRERPQAIAAWSAVAGRVGIVIGPTLGGLLLSHFWWGSVFLINVPLVAAALAGGLLIVPETAEPGSHRLDFAGTLMIAGRCSSWWTPSSRRRPAAGPDRLPWLRSPPHWPGWACSPGGAAHPEPADRPAGVRRPGVLGGGRLGNSDLLRPVRQPVRADPVPPAGTRLQPAVGRVRALPFAIAMAAVSPVSTVLAGRLGSRVVIPAGIAAHGGWPAGPVHGRRAHELPAAGRGGSDHGRGHGPGDGAGQHHHHDHGARPSGRGGQRDQRHDPRSRRRPRDRHHRQPGREHLPLASSAAPWPPPTCRSRSATWPPARSPRRTSSASISAARPVPS